MNFLYVRDALARTGRDTLPGTDLSIGFHFYMAKTQAQGMREAAGYFEEQLKIFGPLRLVRNLTDQQIEAMADPARAPHAGLPTIAGAVQGGGFLCGPAEQIMKLEETYPGLERMNVSHPVGTPQRVILEQLQQFAEEIMPAFTQRVTTTVAAD